MSSELDQSLIGSKMEQSAIGSEMEPSAIGSEMDENAIGSELNENAIGSEIDLSATGSKMDQSMIQSEEIDQEKMDIPAVLLKESEIKKEIIESDVITISDDEDESDTIPIGMAIPMHILTTVPCPNNLLIFKRRSSEPKSLKRCLSVEVAERRCSSAPIDNDDYNELTEPSVCSSISSGSSGEGSSQPKPKKTLKRKRSLIPTYIEVENTRKTMKPGPKSKTRNMVTVHQMITEAKNLASGVTLDSSDESDVEMIFDSDDENDVNDVNDVNDENDENESNEGEEQSEIDPNDYENESYEEDEEVLPKIDHNSEIITINSSDDDEPNHLEPEIGEITIGSEASTTSDNAAEERDRLSLSNNVTTDQKEDEIMQNNEVIKEEIASDDAAEERDCLSLSNNVTTNQKEDKIMQNNEIIKKEIASDDAAEERDCLSLSNNITIEQKEDKIMQNNELKKEEIDTITEDENYNNEILKKSLTDSNEIL